MTEVGTGHDYHLAEPVRTRDGWHSHCDACGVDGPVRLTRAAAEDDALAHDIASNPASNR